jgi:hypothetical protein
MEAKALPPRPLSRHLPRIALGGGLRLHVSRLGADDSGDQPRPPLERGEAPGPVHHHQQAVPEADQKIDVREAPRPDVLALATADQ